MENCSFEIDLENPSETENLAHILAKSITAGDTIFLNGPVGAGKTHFARSFIKSLLTHDEDVPSPTFTLVQTYDTDIGEIWHADLYRLNAEEEIEELGLSDAMIDAVCLIEWPDRLGSYAPKNALHITLTPSAKLEERHFCAQWDDQKWEAKTAGWRNV